MLLLAHLVIGESTYFLIEKHLLHIAHGFIIIPELFFKAPRWRNRQTRRTQNPVMVTSCGFDPHPRHHYYLYLNTYTLPAKYH
jgi:hypothetical protein